ncbi:hypothetical protein J1N35_043134 [Gossypium stocksii]|uniref:Uncharacterized protein n=1 Tax=Gossypium stocksii TaxID=47602 RepID=A0A9D3U6Y4_9ROSI|nr:hypothetical protein J1N35_043134 [Gossypium stocksii]
MYVWFARVRPHTRVAHMPRFALPVWPTWPGPAAHTLVWNYPYGPTRPTWASSCGSHGHILATTRLFLVHGHAFVDHTIVSLHATIYTGEYTPVWHR